MFVRFTLGVVVLGLFGACARPRSLESAATSPPPSEQLWEGPNRVKIDLIRPAARANRIYVQARLGDSEPLLFLVDTGSDVNVLHRPVAEELGLTIDEGHYALAGLSGRTTAGRAVLPEVTLGEAVLSNLPFAVGVRGVSTSAGYMPLAGILGMETWRRFSLQIDYPRDRMVLRPVGQHPKLRGAGEIRMVGNSVETSIAVTTATEPSLTEIVHVQIDTGASALLLAGETGRPFESVATEGLEPIYGVGASEFLPPSQYLKNTRRIPVREVELGGRRFKINLEAQWLGYDLSPGTPRLSTRGLIGHQLLGEHRVWLDTETGVFALRKPWLPRRHRDGHRIMLRQDIERHGAKAPERDLLRARYNIALDRTDRAINHLRRWVENHPDDAEGRVLLARAHRYTADLPGAWQAIEQLGPEGLVDEGEIIATVNGLIFEDKLQQALYLAREAVDLRPDEAEAQLALADALAAVEDFEGANDALLRAAKLRQNPAGFLLRRSRIALALGDRDGAMARVRRQVRENPTDGKALWFYATLLRDEADIATFRADLAEAVDRLHPRQRPFDFLVAAYQTIGDEDRARAYQELGLERDCSRFRQRIGRLNCVAWYSALAHADLDQALRQVDRVLARSGPRADYLDTKAVVHLARGEIERAYQAAIEAAKLMPDDVYMRWQVERISAMRPER